jgi:hypothetical protein
MCSEIKFKVLVLILLRFFRKHVIEALLRLGYRVSLVSEIKSSGIVASHWLGAVALSVLGLVAA